MEPRFVVKNHYRQIETEMFVSCVHSDYLFSLPNIESGLYMYQKPFHRR